MKILFSGYHNPHFHTITEYIESAIRKLGHVLFIFEDRQHIIPGRVRSRFKWLHRIDLNYINRKLLTMAKTVRPDITIVTGGHRIQTDTIKCLKQKAITTALWTIDAPRVFLPIIETAPFYDHIFCQGTEAIELLKQFDIISAHWLPMACDPYYHHPVELSVDEKRHYGNDLVFVGSYYPNRAKLFERLTEFDLGIWGPGWEMLPFYSPLKKLLRGSRIKPEDWIKIYNASKTILAPHYQDPQGRVLVHQASPRVFEALACGAFVISDDQKDVFSIFNDGEHLVRFKTSEDLIKKIKYYFAHPLERRKIAEKGRRTVLEKHTYEHRIQSLLSIARHKL